MQETSVKKKKSNFPSTMLEDSLNCLSILSIEKAITKLLSNEEVANMYATLKK